MKLATFVCVINNATAANGSSFSCPTRSSLHTKTSEIMHVFVVTVIYVKLNKSQKYDLSRGHTLVGLSESIVTLDAAAWAKTSEFNT